MKLTEAADWAVSFWESFGEIKLSPPWRDRAEALIERVQEDPEYAAYLLCVLQMEMEGV